MSKTLPKRVDVPREQTWNLASIFPSPEAWEEEFSLLEGQVPEFARFVGRLGEASELKAYLELFWDLQGRLGKLSAYTLDVAADQSNMEAKSRAARLQGLFARAAAATAFDRPEVLALGMDRLRAMMAQDNGLKLYERAFELLERSRPFVRSGEVEQILGSLIEPFSGPYSTRSSLIDGELKFRPVSQGTAELPVAPGTIDGLVSHENRQVRREAYSSYMDGFLSVKNTLTDLYLTQVRQVAFEARTRGYPSALAATLEPREVPLAALDAVIEAFKANLPLWHRFWALRARALGLSDQGLHDVHASLAHAPVQLPYRTAVEWVLEGLAPLGKEYTNIASRGLLEERWVDVYPNEGKTSGAFSAGSRGTHPFILLNHTDDLGGLSTLAHELGHSMHSYLTWQSQPSVYADYGIFVAEVASNFNQALVRASLEKKQNDREYQLSLIDEAFGNFHRYLFVMPTLARFEREIHERVWNGEGLTADDLNERMCALFLEGYGPAMHIEGPDRDRLGITWATFPHLYMPFYVFQYATGIAAANALAADVLAGNTVARDGYLAFLRSGSSVSQLDALRLAGVDMTSPEPLKRGFKALEHIVERLEKLVG